MMKQIIGIHAHDSNISYMEALFNEDDIVKKHLIIKPQMDLEDQRKKLMALIKKELKSDVVGFMITCTVYASLIEESDIDGVPIWKIEDPIIEAIIQDDHQKFLFFSNPDTVPLTMAKVKAGYQKKGKESDYQVRLIPDSFPLIMSGQQAAYEEAIKEAIAPYLQEKGSVYLMQLSMSLLDGTDNVKTVYGAARESCNVKGETFARSLKIT